LDSRTRTAGERAQAGSAPAHPTNQAALDITSRFRAQLTNTAVATRYGMWRPQKPFARCMCFKYCLISIFGCDQVIDKELMLGTEARIVVSLKACLDRLDQQMICLVPHAMKLKQAGLCTRSNCLSPVPFFGVHSDQIVSHSSLSPRLFCGSFVRCDGQLGNDTRCSSDMTAPRQECSGVREPSGLQRCVSELRVRRSIDRVAIVYRISVSKLIPGG
jgi:hypothetical protein